LSSGHRAHHPTAEQDGLLTTLKSILEIIVFAIFIVTFIVQPFRIPSGSMEPTLRVGDFLLVDKQSYAHSGELDRLVLPPARVERGDLVVFHYPVDPRLHLVKRVVGVPGDRIRMRGGRVLVNGVVLEEPYAFCRAGRMDFGMSSLPCWRLIRMLICGGGFGCGVRLWIGM